MSNRSSPANGAWVLLRQYKSWDAITVINNFMKENKDSKTRKFYVQQLFAETNYRTLDVLILGKYAQGHLPLFMECMSYILLNLSDDVPHHKDYRVKITKIVLDKHKEDIKRALFVPKQNRIRPVLNCLRAMVSIGEEPAEMVLKFLIDNENWTRKCLDMRSCNSTNNARGYYVQLILTFLMYPHLLIKTDLLLSILTGLKYDSSEQVLEVIRVLHDFLLNPGVTKEVKVSLFTPKTTLHLFNLCEWEVPEALKKNKNEKQIESLNEESVVVTEELHAFMVTLLSSEKYGIWFKMKPKENVIVSNQNVHNIICGVYNPWISERKRQFMAHILAAFPVLLGSYLESLQGLVFPRSSQEFIVLMKMVVIIMKRQTPWIWVQSGNWRTAVSCLFPGRPLLPEFYLKLSRSKHRGTRHVGCLLMLTILKKVKQTIENMKDLELSVEDKERVHQELRESISTTFTNQTLKSMIDCIEETLVDVSKQGVGVTSEEGGDEAEESYDIDVPPSREILAILDFQCIYNELRSSVFGETLDPLNIFQILKVLPFLEVSKQTSNDFTIMNDIWMSCHYLLTKSFSNRKFSVNTSNLEENVFYILIATFAQFQKCSMPVSEGNDKLTSFANIIVYGLGKTGILDDVESIKHWLWHISGPEYIKLCTFLMHVIQHTVNSYNQYTDQLIELKEKYGECSEFAFGHSSHLNLCSDKTSLAHVCNKPFSRFVLASVDLLSGNPDAECTKYLSCVLNDYIHTLHNPRLLMSFLLEKENVIDESLKEYLRCFFEHPEHSWKAKSYEHYSDLDLSALLKKSFMTQDWSSLDSLLESGNIPRELIKSDLCTLVLQVVMYLMIEFEKENSSGTDVMKKYTKLLEKLYVSLKVDHKESAALLAKTVLEDPRMLLAFSPLHCSKCSVSSLCQHFIESLLIENWSFESSCYPYFLKALTTVKSELLQQDLNSDIWRVLIPFMSSEITVISNEDIEELLLICLKTPLSTDQCHSSFIHSLLNLLLKKMTAKCQPREETIHMILKMYIEWSTAEQGLEIFTNVLAAAENILLLTLTEEVAKEISKKDVKKLFLQCPSSSKICCHLAELHQPHRVYMAAKLKDFEGDLTTRAQLVTLLLHQEENKNAAQEALKNLLEFLKQWAMNLTDSDQVYHDLLVYSLSNSMMGTDDIADICSHVYEEVVNLNVVPAKDITLLPLLFEKVSDNETFKSKQHVGDSNLALLHLYLSIIKSLCKKGSTNIVFLANCCHELEVILPKICSEDLRSITENKLWPSFIKEVLRASLNNQAVGTLALRSLELMIDSLYKDKRHFKIIEKQSSISLLTVFQMMISHTKYLHLMFQRDAEWDQLKESVVALQQTIVDKNGSVCMEEHVPVLLGAYGASMSAADQRILKLLHTYEVNGAMKRYQPVLWGETAVMHFGKEKNNFRIPKVSQILAQLESSKILKSCRLFDMTLPLEPCDIYGDDRSIYDLRFIIPLMLYLGEDEEILEIDFAESGAVAVAFTCLSSYQKEVWGAGAAILKCVIAKMTDSRHHRFKLPWVWIVTIVSSSFNGEPRRIPSVIVHFLLHVICLLSNPQDPMYFPMLRGMFVRPKLNLRVPQLSRLYASESFDDSHIHLSFLLNALSTGIRLPEDYFICEKDSISMLVVSLLHSPLAYTGIKVRALQVIESMVRLPVAARDLVIKQNLLTMLPAAISTSCCELSIKPDDDCYSGKSSLIAGVVKVLEALWPSMFLTLEKKTPLIERLQLRETNKRKRDDEENCINDIVKKFKTADGVAGVGKQADVTDSEPEAKQLRPIFLEEYLHCLLHLTSTVVEDASPVCVARHLTLLVNAVKYIVESSKGFEKETLRTVALDPQVVKKRVYECVPWDGFYKCLRSVLTDAEEARLLGPKTEMRETELAQHTKKEKHGLFGQNVGSTELKTAVFNLLHLLDR